MRLSLREKQSFYQHLAQLLRAGVTFPAAVEKLTLTARGAQREFLRQLGQALGRGAAVEDAFAELRPKVSEMERTALAALARTGRMDRGLLQLADYFGALAQARAAVLRHSAYPIFILHFGVVLLNVPLIFSADLGTYLRQTGLAFLVIYLVAAIVALAFLVLRDAGAASGVMDRVLRMIPLVGKMRRAFALARFCAAYDMQLEAGVNVIDSLRAAGSASQSALIRHAAMQAVPGVKEGSQVGPLLAQSGAFPAEMIRSFLVAEETGQLDRELARMAAEYQTEALTRLNTLSEWVPRLIYVGIVVYLGWKMIALMLPIYGPNGILRQFDAM